MNKIKRKIDWKCGKKIKPSSKNNRLVAFLYKEGAKYPYMVSKDAVMITVYEKIPIKKTKEAERS